MLHYPGIDKKQKFDQAIDKKLNAKDFNFRGAWFPEGFWLSGFVFAARVDLFRAIFNGDVSLNRCTLDSGIDLTRAVFSGNADFSDVIFKGSSDFSDVEFTQRSTFERATFEKEVRFTQARFDSTCIFASTTFTKKADFSRAIFSSETDFMFADFSGDTHFTHATFKNEVRFVGDASRKVFGTSLNLQYSRVERPERVYFHSLTLVPAWFVGVDPSKFAFVDVEWREAPGLYIDDLTDEPARPATIELSKKRMLAAAYRQLAINCEENHRYEESSRFRYRAMDLQRQAKWRGLAFWKLDWWYWAASGYGERVFRAFLMLVAVWLLFAWFYTKAGFKAQDRVIQDTTAAASDEHGVPLSFSRALIYSFGVLTLQKPEPRPATETTYAVVSLETVFGPIQAGLLALAIRRKFLL